MSTYHLIATCPKGLEQLLCRELESLGLTVVGERIGHVLCSADLTTIYRACLWSRLANRILLVLNDVPVVDVDSFYQAVYDIPWLEHLPTGGSLAVDFSGTLPDINHTHFGALKTKDAIVDHCQRQAGWRPSVDTESPDLRINIRGHKGRAVIAIDLVGESLHRRGYRQLNVPAPLKENLAAALLMRADWPAIASRGGALIDPMCGSGTFLIEAAWMAMGIAPGILRVRWGFERWVKHRDDIWQPVLQDAQRREEAALQRQWPEIRGYDNHPGAIRASEENIRAAGLEGKVRVSRKEVADLVKPTHRELIDGLLIVNPPYGERLGEVEELKSLYRELGDKLKQEFTGWQAAVFTSNPELGKNMGLKARKKHPFYNGPLQGVLLLFTVSDEYMVSKPWQSEEEKRNAPLPLLTGDLTPGAQMLANRLQKNRKKLRKWLKQEAIEAYRLYDADMPEYAVAIDIYGEQIHVAEYAAPATINVEDAQRRLQEAIQAIAHVFEVPQEAIVLKRRQRQRGSEQYLKQNRDGNMFPVREGNVSLLVNLTDYLDTGLFVDHRKVRRFIAENSRDKRFLNLFCYTGAATVHAAAGGALSTTSVDLSATYLDWLAENLAYNHLGEGQHELLQGDCLQFMAECRDQFDLIFFDPPTFSNSKRMADTLDIQRDHPQLVEHAMDCLADDGLLIFSTNRQKFKLDPRLADYYEVEDKTQWSLDPDVSRLPPIHYCWFIRHRLQS